MALDREVKSRKKAPLRETAAQTKEQRAAEAAKIARLRALRLAKEAAERSAEEDAAAARASRKPSVRVRGQPRTPA